MKEFENTPHFHLIKDPLINLKNKHKNYDTSKRKKTLAENMQITAFDSHKIPDSFTKEDPKKKIDLIEEEKRKT